jgi:hypothetical protein
MRETQVGSTSEANEYFLLRGDWNTEWNQNINHHQACSSIYKLNWPQWILFSVSWCGHIVLSGTYAKNNIVTLTEYLFMSYLSLLDRVTNSMELGHYLSRIQARPMLIMCGNAHMRKILNRTHELKQVAAYCGGKRHASECAWCTLCIESFRVRYIPCGCGEEVTQWNLSTMALAVKYDPHLFICGNAHIIKTN